MALPEIGVDISSSAAFQTLTGSTAIRTGGAIFDFTGGAPIPNDSTGLPIDGALLAGIVIAAATAIFIWRM